jgi:hypothetical protein
MGIKAAHISPQSFHNSLVTPLRLFGLKRNENTQFILHNSIRYDFGGKYLGIATHSQILKMDGILKTTQL